jgi:hypothetical protein
MSRKGSGEILGGFGGAEGSRCEQAVNRGKDRRAEEVLDVNRLTRPAWNILLNVLAKVFHSPLLRTSNCLLRSKFTDQQQQQTSSPINNSPRAGRDLGEKRSLNN